MSGHTGAESLHGSQEFLAPGSTVNIESLSGGVYRSLSTANGRHPIRRPAITFFLPTVLISTTYLSVGGVFSAR